MGRWHRIRHHNLLGQIKRHQSVMRSEYATMLTGINDPEERRSIVEMMQRSDDEYEDMLRETIGEENVSSRYVAAERLVMLTRHELAHLALAAHAVIPPPLAEFTLHLLLPGAAGDALIGDLSERFAQRVKATGPRRAKMLYWAEAIRSLAPLALRLMTRAGVWTMLYTLLRKFTG